MKQWKQADDYLSAMFKLNSTRFLYETTAENVQFYLDIEPKKLSKINFIKRTGISVFSFWMGLGQV